MKNVQWAEQGAHFRFEGKALHERAGSNTAKAERVERLGRPRVAVDADQIARLRAQGRSWPQIARELSSGFPEARMRNSAKWAPDLPACPPAQVRNSGFPHERRISACVPDWARLLSRVWLPQHSPVPQNFLTRQHGPSWPGGSHQVRKNTVAGKPGKLFRTHPTPRNWRSWLRAIGAAATISRRQCSYKWRNPLAPSSKVIEE